MQALYEDRLIQLSLSAAAALTIGHPWQDSTDCHEFWERGHSLAQ